MKLIESVKEKAYKITSIFEGSGFSNMAGNFDGQYLSFGTFQWNFGMGTLQPLFMKLFNEYQYVADSCLPEGGKWLKDAIENGWVNEWALQIQENNQIVEPWKTALYNLGQTPEFQKIEMDATQQYVDIAINLCNSFGLYTERAFCLFFDIAIQNGGLSYYEMMETEYYDRLVSIATVCANKSSSKWRDIVLARKMCIVNGYGNINCSYMNFDISDENAFDEEQNDLPQLNESISLLAEHKIIKDTSYWIENVYTGNSVEGAYVQMVIKKFIACYKLFDTYDQVLDELVSMGIVKDKSYWEEHAIYNGICDGQYVEILINNMAKYIS